MLAPFSLVKPTPAPYAPITIEPLVGWLAIARIDEALAQSAYRCRGLADNRLI
jgi:hypothetical protein